MKLVDILVCFAIVSEVSAATFRAPVHIAKRAVDTRTNISKHPEQDIAGKARTARKSQGFHCQDARKCGPLSRHSEGQHYLGDVKHNKLGLFDTGEDGGETPVWDIDKISYITSLSIGTPPQSFNMLLSISSSDLTVPDSTCDYRCGNYSVYNENLSSSYVPHNERFLSDYLRLMASNLLSEDTLQLGGVNITHQKFGAADDMSRRPFSPFWGWDDPNWDGILGLAPANHSSMLGLLNPLQNMREQKILDRNLFSLKLPRGEEDPGEILFGDVNQDLFTGKLKTLPVVNDPEIYPPLRGSWAVPATSVSIGTGTAYFEKGCVAAVDSEFPVIGLPEDHVLMLLKYLGMEHKGEREPPSIDCSKRAELEDLTFKLGYHDLVITPHEYTMEINSTVWGGKRCMTAIYPLPPSAKSYIALGTAFLKRFYTVFDLDKQTVSFAELSPPKKTNFDHLEGLEYKR